MQSELLPVPPLIEEKQMDFMGTSWGVKYCYINSVKVRKYALQLRLGYAKTPLAADGSIYALRI